MSEGTAPSVVLEAPPSTGGEHLAVTISLPASGDEVLLTTALEVKQATETSSLFIEATREITLHACFFQHILEALETEKRPQHINVLVCSCMPHIAYKCAKRP